MLTVGQRHRAKRSFTREQVAQYCALAGDHNAIHRDLAAARLRFPKARDIIVPGGLIQISVTGIFGSEFPGDGCLGLSFTSERIRKPICPGDEIWVTLEIVKIRGPMIEMHIALEDDQGQHISAASSRLIAADASYRAWWEAAP